MSIKTGMISMILAGWAGSATAQSELAGKVRSQVKEGSGVAGATVSIEGQRTATDSSGRFRFSRLKPGRHTLTVTAVGFEAWSGNWTLPSADTVLIELREAESSLDAVVVTGTLKPVQRLESPIAVEVYTPQFFKKNPTPSIFEALQNVNGVRPQINCNVCNTGDIHINGLEGPYTMVTIDGMPIVSSLSSVYGLFGIPNQMIERVEIVKGPASGLYGSEAVGGLINIITRSPEKSPRLTASLMSTSWNEHNADLGFRFRAGRRVSSLVGINYFRYLDPRDNNGDGFTDATLQHRISVFNKWSFQRKSQRTASLALRYFRENRWGGEMDWEKKFRGTDSVYGESIDTKRWEAIGSYQLPLKEKMIFSFSATGHHQDSYYGVTPYMGRQNIVFGQLIWNRSLGSHDLLAGLAARYNGYDDNTTATIDTLSLKNRPDRSWLPGVFVQDEWDLGLHHTVLLGLRYDRHSVHGNIFTPRIAYKWTTGPGRALRLNAGTGFRVVNIFTEDHAALTGARAVEIREELKPEKSYNVNLNYAHRLGNSSLGFQFDASAWYSYFHNQIIADYDTDPSLIIYNNLRGHSLSKGFTLNVEANRMQRLKALLGLTLQDVARVEEHGGDKQRIRPILTERWSGTWSVSYVFPVPGLTLDYTGNIYGPMRLPLLSALDPRSPESPVWSLQNLQATKWIARGWEVFGGIKNLLNWTPAKASPFLIARANDPFDKRVDYAPDGSVRATPENPYALSFDPSYVYAPNQGRRFFLGIRYVSGK